ncbi:MAG: VOC family protein [Bacteroidota bacterium]
MTTKKIIYGIQQVGVGVTDAQEAFRWYAKHLGADLMVFDDHNVAEDMARYMGGQPRAKHAILAMNHTGGGGYEIWQYSEREPQAADFSILLGDTGVNFMTIKSYDVPRAYEQLQGSGATLLTEPADGKDGHPAFYFKDPYGNLIHCKHSDNWFSKKNGIFGAVLGVGIGVSDIDAALPLYSGVLGYSKVVYDYVDESNAEAGRLRRVLLRREQYPTGGFSPLLGESEVELIQALDRQSRKIFEDRYWGDLGYIHVCFDTRNIQDLIQECAAAGFPFTVQSDPNFEMGDTNGAWGYLEDADGSLVEFVEAHKVPLIKALNWSIQLKGRDPHKPLPNWLLKAMATKRVRVS